MSTPTITPGTSVVPAPARTAVGRRGLLFGAAGLTAGGLATMVGSGAVAAEPRSTDAAARKPVLVGANPGVQLFDAEGACTGYASVWMVDWSEHGSGDVIVLWRPEVGVTVLGTNMRLARYVAEDFTRHFPEMDGLPWGRPAYVRRPVHVEMSLADGVQARSGAVQVRASQILDVRSFTTDEFALGDVEHSLHLVLGPCGEGSIRVAGRRLPGDIITYGDADKPGSTAFVADAEVWKR